MKKVIAFLLAVLYFVFTTFTWWQVNDGNDQSWPNGNDAPVYAIAADDGGTFDANNVDILSEKLLGKASKHVTATAKIKIPRANFVGLAYKDFLFNSPSDFCGADFSMATPLLCKTPIYLKNCILRI